MLVFMVQPRLYWYSWFSLHSTGIYGSGWTIWVFVVQPRLSLYWWFSLSWYHGSGWTILVVRSSGLRRQQILISPNHNTQTPGFVFPLFSQNLVASDIRQTKEHTHMHAPMHRPVDARAHTKTHTCTHTHRVERASLANATESACSCHCVHRCLFVPRRLWPGKHDAWETGAFPIVAPSLTTQAHPPSLTFLLSLPQPHSSSFTLISQLP